MGDVGKGKNRRNLASAISLQQLRLAVVASDCGSFRRAADVLSIKHTVLSRSISQLEYLIGASLFERSSGGIKPTLAGRTVLRIARLILEQIDTLAEAANAGGRGGPGHFTVGFCTSISAGHLRATLREFKRQCPHVELATVERSRIRLMTALRNGTVDLVVSPGRLFSKETKALPLWSERILISLPEDHALAAHEVIHWTDLREQTILLSQYDPGRELEDILMSKLLLPEDRPKIEHHDVSRGIIKSLVSMGLGLSLVMESDIGASFAGLVYRELQDGLGSSRLDFYAHWRHDSDNPILHRFLDLLTERYPSPPPPLGE
ncbi:LysR family transcriptional regulator [Bradyrhizobium japonicum]|uniref:LysR family transcriptional regulator n=1 Tax=Bradyrhizobium japonicum TaxID=375 RepID=UPI001BAC03E9|nr:LysR family transcriptional regulator [Bradyrhizobium japonicum]MBR0733171.1 LysR family transcriptional regulator [Bradyrhizobium japonicum]